MILWAIALFRREAGHPRSTDALGAGGRGSFVMPAELKIDRAVYLVDEATRTYRYLRRNPGWRDLDPEENERHKRHLDGYTRIFPDGGRKVFRS